MSFRLLYNNDIKKMWTVIEDSNTFGALGLQLLSYQLIYVIAIVRIIEIPLAPMGVLASGSAHSRPSARPPIDVSGKFSAAHVCRVTFKHLP